MPNTPLNLLRCWVVLTNLVMPALPGTPFVQAQASAKDYYCGFQVIGYYPDYHGEPLIPLRYDQLTQVIFFSIYPNSDATLNTGEISLARQAEFIEAAHAENTLALVCVGGWRLSDNFSEVCANPADRLDLVTNLHQFCLTHHYDGIVLDWEPVITETDRTNYTLLIQELHTAIADDGLTLTVAVGALGHEFNIPAIAAIDWLHIMAYDMTDNPALPHSTYEDAMMAMDHWDTFGVPRRKIILGLPFYGRDGSWDYYYSYRSILEIYAPGPEADEVAGIHYNGIDTVQDKTRAVVEQNYGGVMFWEAALDSDDSTSLLTAIGDEILYRRPADFDCNGQINLSDLEHFAAQWLSTDCRDTPAWCGAADRNQTGNVDLADLILLAEDWLSP